MFLGMLREEKKNRMKGMKNCVWNYLERNRNILVQLELKDWIYQFFTKIKTFVDEKKN